MTSQQNSTLSDFEPEKLQKENAQKEEDQKVMNLLGRFTAEMLKDALINEGGHPLPEWGYGETWRYYYLKECERRGKRLLEQLGWPTKEDSLFVNLHTGDVETLIDIVTSHGYFSDRHTIDSQVWSVIEHWETYDDSKPNKYKIQYLKEEIERLNHILQTGGAKEYMKRTRAELAEKQSILEAEKSKMQVI
jgi:hypothetical protein